MKPTSNYIQNVCGDATAYESNTIKFSRFFGAKEVLPFAISPDIPVRDSKRSERRKDNGNESVTRVRLSRVALLLDAAPEDFKSLSSLKNYVQDFHYP